MSSGVRVPGRLSPHHRHGIERSVEALREDATVLGVLVGGSLAKGMERPDSDVDLMIVVTEDEFARRRARNDLTLLRFDWTDYPGGYVDAKFIDIPFLRAAAERGSEPTRDSFTGVWAAWSRCDEDLDALAARIPVYPEHEREAKIRSFYSQFVVQDFFAGEGEKRGDPFLLAHAASQKVLFGGRLLLVHNRMLFPSAKRLLERVAAAPDKPADFLPLADALTRAPSLAAARALNDCVIGFRDWGLSYGEALGQYTADSEFNWLDARPPLAEC